MTWKCKIRIYSCVINVHYWDSVSTGLLCTRLYLSRVCFFFFHSLFLVSVPGFHIQLSSGWWRCRRSFRPAFPAQVERPSQPGGAGGVRLLGGDGRLRPFPRPSLRREGGRQRQAKYVVNTYTIVSEIFHSRYHGGRLYIRDALIKWCVAVLSCVVRFWEMQNIPEHHFIMMYMAPASQHLHGFWCAYFKEFMLGLQQEMSSDLSSARSPLLTH